MPVKAFMVVIKEKLEGISIVVQNTDKSEYLQKIVDVYLILKIYLIFLSLIKDSQKAQNAVRYGYCKDNNNTVKNSRLELYFQVEISGINIRSWIDGISAR